MHAGEVFVRFIALLGLFEFAQGRGEWGTTFGIVFVQMIKLVFFLCNSASLRPKAVERRAMTWSV